MAAKPKTAGQAKRRDEIIAVATSLFDSAGYHQTSMDDIAEKVGIAKPTLYHYYTGKAQILAEIHEEFVAEMIGSLRARHSEGVDANDQLRALTVDIFRFIEKRRGHVKVFYEHQQDLPDESRAHITKLRSELTRAVAQLIEECIANGSFRDVDPTMAARALFGMCNWSYHWFKPKNDPQATADFMYDVFFKGVGA